MVLLARSCLVGLLIASLIAAPAAGSSARPVGVVVQAEHASVGQAGAIAGAPVFTGDTVRTEHGGTLRILVGTAQIYLLTNSAAKLSDGSQGTSATLLRGTLGFTSSGKEAVGVRAGQALIHPQKAQPTYGQVTQLSPTELVVSSYRGPLEIETAIGENLIVPEATSYRVLLGSGSQKPEGTGSGGAMSASTKMILIGAGIAAGVVVAVVLKQVLASRN
jgi:hypothetical protein